MTRRTMPSVVYAPGFFTELARKHNFPPGFAPTGLDPKDKLSAAGKIGGGMVSATERTRLAAGSLAPLPNGRGTIAGLSKRAQADVDKNERIRRGRSS